MISSGGEVRQVPGGEEGNAAELGLEQDQQEVNICSRLGLDPCSAAFLCQYPSNIVMKY